MKGNNVLTVEELKNILDKYNPEMKLLFYENCQDSLFGREFSDLLEMNGVVDNAVALVFRPTYMNYKSKVEPPQ